VLIKAGIMPRLIDRIKSEESNQFVQWSAVGALKNLIVGGGECVLCDELLMMECRGCVCTVCE
jgi:hypothetical protein